MCEREVVEADDKDTGGIRVGVVDRVHAVRSRKRRGTAEGGTPGWHLVGILLE